MAITMTGVALLAYFELNVILVFVIMIFLAFYQLTLGTYSWNYLGQVACEEGLSLATFALWLCVFILSVVTNMMFDKMLTYGTFAFFASCSYLSFIFFYFFMRETKGLSRDQQ